MMERPAGYDALASVYDSLNRSVDYERIADFYEACIRRFGRPSNDPVLDLGCGTGTLTSLLASRGFDMIGVDGNESMLAQARNKYPGQDILWLQQDMTSLDLYGTVSCAVSSLDCLNHLLTSQELDRCLEGVSLFLAPGGLFLFDVNTPEKFRREYADRDYILEEDGVLCAWHNEWHPARKVCDFYLSVFEETENGTYRRTDGVQRERCYSRSYLTKKLKNHHFDILGVYDSWSFTEATEQTERWLFVTRCMKEEI